MIASEIDLNQSFAEHWSLDPSVTYLNHGAFGACPIPVLEKQRELRARMEANPMRFLVRECHALIDRSRERLAQEIGAKPADVVFSANVSASVSAILASIDFKPGDEVLVTDHGYSACTTAAQTIAARAGASVVTAHIPLPVVGEDDIVEPILAAVTGKTRLAIIDHITSPTGIVFPVKRIVAELERRGVEVLVDGAHAPGMIDLDIESLGAPWYAGHCHKWFCAPKGASFFYARQDKQASLDPLIMSHGMHSPRKGKSRFHDVFDWPGTFDPTAWCCVADAIDFLASLLPGGLSALRDRNHQLAVQGQRVLCQALPARPICPESMLGSFAAMSLPDDPAAEPRYADVHSTTPVLQSQMDLADRGVEIPWMGFPSFPSRLIRISAQAYNTLDDYHHAAGQLGEVLKQTPTA